GPERQDQRGAARPILRRHPKVIEIEEVERRLVERDEANREEDQEGPGHHLWVRAAARAPRQRPRQHDRAGGTGRGDGRALRHEQQRLSSRNPVLQDPIHLPSPPLPPPLPLTPHHPPPPRRPRPPQEPPALNARRISSMASSPPPPR